MRLSGRLLRHLWLKEDILGRSNCLTFKRQRYWPGVECVVNRGLTKVPCLGEILTRAPQPIDCPHLNLNRYWRNLYLIHDRHTELGSDRKRTLLRRVTSFRNPTVHRHLYLIRPLLLFLLQTPPTVDEVRRGLSNLFSFSVPLPDCKDQVPFKPLDSLHFIRQ